MASTPQALPIDIESEMRVVVRRMGGIVVADKLGSAATSKNADFLFPDDDVVAELKCMEQDTRIEPTFLEKTKELHRGWVRRGLVPPPPPEAPIFTFNIRDLPQECAFEFLDMVKKRIERLVDKASRQIKATKAHFARPNAKGLLLLANDGDYMFTLEAISHFLARILKGHYKLINTVVYFTPNLKAHVPGNPGPSSIWADMLVHDGPDLPRDSVPRSLLDTLRDQWMQHIATLHNSQLTVYNLSQPTVELVEGIRFVQGDDETARLLQKRAVAK